MRPLKSPRNFLIDEVSYRRLKSFSALQGVRIGEGIRLLLNEAEKEKEHQCICDKKETGGTGN